MKVSHGGLGTREYFEECVAKTVRTVKRAARKRGNHAGSSPEVKDGAKSKWESAKKTPTMTKPAPESVKMRQAQTESARKTPKVMPPPPAAKSVKIRLVRHDQLNHIC